MNKADKHLYPTQTSASMSPNTFRPPTLTFNPSIFPLFLFPSSLPLYMAATGGALLFVAGAGKGRSGLHLSFASCYHFSHLCTHPAPSLPVFLLTPPPPYLPSSVFLPLTYSNRSGVKRGKARAELTHDTELLTLQLGEPSAAGCLLARTLRPSVFALVTLVSLPPLGQEHKG